jgi:hypothetical protein
MPVEVVGAGIARTCPGFASTSVKCASSMCQTGFQYTPVASSATISHCCCSATRRAREPARRGRNPCARPQDLSSRYHTRTPHHFVLVHVEAGTPAMNDVHSTPPGWRSAELAILQSTKRAPVPAEDRPARGHSMRCGTSSRSKLTTGSQHQSGRRPLCQRLGQGTLFHPSRCAVTC